ncbi:peptide-methionine (S)-S-oxide reductase MsrA [Aureivirga sp. CE67]|uniref:peptide-methionine (S)-S-oxide reductase MsrA n=1 Tax=Aureivirga sp. CE67 TaxID=1788983 RepID=UPI0018C8EC7E|nr:peptide-methionine (S)-S-oxide reductase MsrA [Aureivirga sp. CE67]
MRNDIATFGGGCFWCLDAYFRQIKGIETVVSGYGGGNIINPAYREVCQGTTGHAEVVQLTFDTSIISYQDLLEIFFEMHDPTTLNQQGYDKGTQYRSVIFYHNEEQKKEAENYIQKLTGEKVFEDPIVTEVSPFKNFFNAENMHQDFYELNPEVKYCQLIISPKMEKLKKKFDGKLK